MVKLLVCSLLALTAANAIAGEMYIYKSKSGQELLTNTSKPSGDFDQFNKKVKTTYYNDENGSRVTTTANYAYDSVGSNSSNSVQEGMKPIENSEIVTASSMQSELEFTVPNGYRLPIEADNFDDWKTFNAPNHLKADFNGDGIEDEAYLLPKKSSKLGYGVFVSLNKSEAAVQSGRKFQMFKLTDRDDMPPQSFAIELAEPSNEIWKSACGKGYWECGIGEPSAFKINHPSIMFCYIESACTIYMWDSKELTFKEITFSD